MGTSLLLEGNGVSAFELQLAFDRWYCSLVVPRESYHFALKPIYSCKGYEYGEQA